MSTNASNANRCTTCIHFRLREGWFCAQNSVAELRERGHPIAEDALPSPAAFVCDDYEPP